ncbi:MAG: DNA internalization-related competence protein ComEC/Rec2 [Tepidimonas sp.]|uniref:DNA internalization-related competence protein ComEC/Rec2 n=1 Tax=Tepidimonas sp. TaxID=2002775 RepID=UPI00298F39C2|nr:DNA internalization-related competence protein ComEC/Rec2 [Tepidimonas sp.]MDW8335939.1 DNA internalization-related competence protein ComEC/Rec2 [Tepidimonas sp.]
MVGLPTAAWWRSIMTAALWGWLGGHALQLLQPTLDPAPTYVAWGLLGLAGLAAAAWRRWAGWPGQLVVWMALALLGAAQAGWRGSTLIGQLWPAALDGAAGWARWRVVGLPREDERGTRFAAELLAFEGLPPGQPVGTVWLSWRGSDPVPPRVWPGQVWEGPLRLQRPRGLANPHGFDVEAWAWREGVAATGSVRTHGPAAPRLLADEPWSAPLARARAEVRARLQGQLAPRFDPAASALVVALVTGDQASLTPAQWEVIRATGVAHLVAISGVHVTMLAVLAVGLTRVAWARLAQRWPGLLMHAPTPVVEALVGVTVAAGYAAFAGGGVPAQRTVAMLALVLALRLLGRRWPWPQLWLAVMAVALAVDPWAWLQSGFWLSFVAVAVLLGRGAAEEDTAPPGQRWRSWAWRYWHTQWAIFVALAPWLLAWFGQLSVVGLLANALAIPWVTWGVTPLALLGVAVPPLADAAAWLASVLWQVLQPLARWPLATWQRPELPWALAAPAALGAWVLVQRWPWIVRAWGALLVWPALAYRPPAPAPGTFEVVLPDVGQGSAVLVRTARHTLVVDSGPPLGPATAAERVLLPWLQALGVRPDAVVLSHDDADHASGWPVLAAAYPQAVWWAPRGATPAGLAHVQSCTAGQTWQWDGVTFAFLHPPPPPADARLPDDNARSCVLWIDQGQTSAVLPGDIPAAVEQTLVAAYPGLRATLLVAAHHGSRTSTSEPWLQTLRPRVVALQAGWRNLYGHPHAEVLQRLAQRGIPVVGTPQCGAFVWRSDRPDAWTCERQRRRFYWQGGTGSRLAAHAAAVTATTGAAAAEAAGDGSSRYRP